MIVIIQWNVYHDLCRLINLISNTFCLKLVFLSYSLHWKTLCVCDIYRTVGYSNLLFSQAGHSVLILITQLLLLRSKKGKSYSITLFFEIAFSCRITISPGWLFSWLQKVLRNNTYLIGSINSPSRLIIIEYTIYEE